MPRIAFAMLATWLALQAQAQVPGGPALAAPESRRSAPADFSPEGLARRVEAIRLDVEAALGEPIGVEVGVVPAARADIERLYFEELVIQRCEIKGGPRGKALREEVSGLASLLANATFAKVGLADGVIRIVPDNFRDRARSHPGEDEGAVLGQDLLDVVLAHEMVHVFQHRRIHLDRFVAPCATSDELACRGAVMEGHADFVARKYAAKRSLSAAFDLYRRLQDTPPSVRDAVERKVAEMASAFFQFQYVEGERFVTAVSGELGAEAALHRIFDTPPRSLREVSKPEEYLRPSASRPDLAAISERMREIAAGRGWKATVTGFPALALKQLFAPLGPKAVTELSAAFLDGKVLARTVSKGRKESTIESVVVMATDSEESAKKLFDAHVELIKKKDEIVRSGEMPSIELLSSEMQILPWGRTPGAWFRKTLFAQNADVAVSGLFVADGRLLWDYEVVLSKVREGSASRPEPASRPADESRPAEPLPGSREALIAFLEPMMRAAESVPAARVVEKPTESRPSQPLVRVTGTVRIVDAKGGNFMLRLWDVGPRRDAILIEGKDGVFEANLPAGRCRIGRVVTDGEDHDELVGNSLTIAEGEPVEIELTEAEATTITIVDAATRKPIPGARVHRLTLSRTYTRYWGVSNLPSFDLLEGPPLVADAGGRARLPRKLDRFENRRVYAEADGHAWQEVKVGRDSRAGIEVELEPAGSLALHVDGWKRLGVCSLRMVQIDGPDDLEVMTAALESAAVESRAASRPSDRLVRMATAPKRGATLPEPDARGRVQVSGLEPGTWLVAIQAGRTSGQSNSLIAAKLVKIEAGAETQAELVAPPIPAAVPLRCRIAVPKGWVGSANWEVVLAGDDELTSGLDEAFDLTGDESRIELRVPRVTPGRYRVRIAGAGWEAPIEVGPGAAEIDLALPEPWRLSVRVEGEGASRAPKDATVRWTRVEGAAAESRTADSSDDFDSVPATPGRDADEFIIQAASGRIRVESVAPGHARGVRWFDARPGAKEEARIRLARGGDLEISITTAEKFAAAKLKLVPIGIEGAAPVEHFFHDKAHTFKNLLPGDYLVSAADEAMNKVFRVKPAEQRVTIRAGETTKAAVSVEFRSPGDDEK
jgi:hypothetical protein